MPLAPVYVSLEDFKAAVTVPDNLTDDDVTRAITAASRAIDLLTGRKFGQTDAEETRRFTASGAHFVSIFDTVSITTLESDGVEVLPANFYAGPDNADLNGEPFEWIEAVKTSFDRKPGGISITGIFGWPAVPTQIEQMTMIFASKLFKRTREAPWGIVTTGTVEGLSLRIVRDDPDAALLTSGLRRAETV